MPGDPQRAPRPDDATLGPPDAGDTASPLGNEVTLPPPPRKPAGFADDTTLPPPSSSSVAKAAPEDATLPPPPRGSSPGVHDFASATTLPPPERTLSGGAPKQRQYFDTIAPAAREASPQDATLDPDAPEAKAYEAAVAKSTPLSTNASFGDYQLIEPIAKGGMGIVYKARQRKLNRIVAIKMILAGQFADSGDVDRFYAEAESAAALSHPNIVGIHEIGEVNGQHFFSMDYIEGDSLSGMVRESPLTPSRAAEFCKTIAETMQFAHERGIVHRDLKPSNVLLDKQNRPLITDFGLAKSFSNQSQLTMSGAIIGTPSYMPPEQARGDAAAVGPCSDIYSTGAILYELVTGRPPFRAATPFETVRQVVETEPLSPRLVNPSVPKDLETICLKCLQKDPAKRYATSQELADELGRFLRGEPIHARPIGRVARFARWCKRNPVVAGAVAAAVLLLVFAAVSSSIALAATKRRLAEREKSQKLYIDAVNDLFTYASESTLLNQPGAQAARKEILAKALEHYQRFSEEIASDQALEDELAVNHFRIGVITEALESGEKALPSYERARNMQARLLKQSPDDPARLEALGNTLNAIGVLRGKQRRYAAAHREYEQALALRQRLADTDPTNPEFQRALANIHMNVGLARYSAEEHRAARESYQQAQGIRQVALTENPGHVKLRRDFGKGEFNLGIVNTALNSPQDALHHFQAAAKTFRELYDENSRDFDNTMNLAIAERLIGEHFSSDPKRVSEARQAYQKAEALLEELTKLNPDVLDYALLYAGVNYNLGILELHNQRPTEAMTALEKSRKVLNSLVQSYPKVLRYRRDLAKTLQAIGWQHMQSAETLTQARLDYQAAMELLDGLLADRPNEQEYEEHLAAVLMEWGDLEFNSRQFAEAVALRSRALAFRQTLRDKSGDNPGYKLDHAAALFYLGEAEVGAQLKDAADAHFKRAEVQLLELKRDPAVAEDASALLNDVRKAQQALKPLSPAGC